MSNPESAVSNTSEQSTSAATAAADVDLNAQPAVQTMDINQIMAILPHRYPFLLIDRVIELEHRKRVVAIKNVTVNEPHFTGHFPGFPLMPGVLIVEAIAQASGTLVLTEIPDRENSLMVFAGIEGAKFRRPVVPGDQLRIEVTVLNWRRNAVRMLGIVTVEGKVACEATITCMVMPKPAPEAASKQPVTGGVAQAAGLETTSA